MAKAHAPYNFIPLNSEREILPAEELLPHNAYDLDRKTGYFDVHLTTETPLFIRGMLTKDQVKKNAANTDGEPEKNLRFFMPDGKIPYIPGSSLRGMIRNLFEIITFGKMHFVSDANKIFFRAVAAKRDDPLGSAYKQALGSFGKKVRAGFLRYHNGEWFILQAKPFGKDVYAKVKDKTKRGEVPVEGVQDIIRFNDKHKEYHVQSHEVAYDESKGFITRVYTPAQGEPATAVLVCSGNMLETDGGNTKSPRKNYALISKRTESEPIRIPKQIVQDYVDGLSPFQKEAPYFDSEKGVLRNGYPVFFVEQNGEVIRFGHTPNFRVAHLIDDTNDHNLRAVTPLDRVPVGLLNDELIDYTDAVFGAVHESTKQAIAGRISITGANLLTEPTDVEHKQALRRVPGSPKPTTFQHYLKQNPGSRKQDLRHYGDDDAQIRGHKLYWRQNKQFDALQKENSDGSKPNVETEFYPVKREVEFQFRVHFENLTHSELGALVWVMTLGEHDKEKSKARHMLGMGKPYGMGVLKLDPTLYISNREQRYGSLFDGDSWQQGDEAQSPKAMMAYVDAFKEALRSSGIGDFDTHERMQELMHMLELHEPHPDFDYMQIEGQRGNEYKDRPVLPSPSEVIKRL